MNNFVSFDKAKKMKEAGFPQPEPEIWQVWYGLLTGESEVNILISYNAKGYFTDIFSNHHSKESFKKFGIYAPTVEDILKELGHDYYLSAENGHFAVRWSREMEIVAEGENIAEELAKFYLS